MSNSQRPLSSEDFPNGEPTFPPEALSNCARLIASGEMEWPAILTAEQAGELEVLVRRARRLRLVKLIASCIAADIAKDTRG